MYNILEIVLIFGAYNADLQKVVHPLKIEKRSRLRQQPASSENFDLRQTAEEISYVQ